MPEMHYLCREINVEGFGCLQPHKKMLKLRDLPCCTESGFNSFPSPFFNKYFYGARLCIN